MAKRNRCVRSLLLTALSVVVVASGAVAAPRGNPNSPLNEILLQLDALHTEMQGLKMDIASVKKDVAGVQREVITCTLKAKKAGLCDRVRETKASACFDMSVLEAKLGAKWIGQVKAKGEGGAGWTSGPDGKITIDVRMPVAAVPSDFGLEIAPKLGLKGEICVEIPLELLPPAGARASGTTVASSLATSEADYEALASRFEQIGAAIVPLVMDRVDSRMPDGDRLVAGVQAVERLGDGDLTFLHGDLLSDPLLLDVADIMPTPVMLRTAIQNPTALRSRIPALDGNVKQRVARLCNPQTGLSIVRSPLFSGASGQICSHLDAVPDFDGIAVQLLDIPEATAAIVDGLLDKTQQITQNTSNWFCARPLFANTRLCK